MRSWKRLLAALLVMAMLVPMTTALSEELPVNASDVLAIEYQEAPQEDAEPAAANTAAGEEPGALPEEVEAQLSENGIAANDSDAPAAQTYELTVDPAAKVQTFTMSVNDTLRLRLSEGTADGWSTTKKNVVTFTPSGDYTDVRADAEAKKIKLTTKVTGASKKTASVNLVINNPYTPTGVTLADMPEWVPVGATINLPEKVVLTPTYAVTTLTYKATGAGKVTKEGVFTASKAGKAKITVTPSNNKKIKYTYTLPVLGNKVDKMNGKPSAGDIAAVAGGWTLWPVTLEVKKNGTLLAEFYVLNGTGEAIKQIENMTLSIAAGRPTNVVAELTQPVVKVSVAKNKFKLLKVTFPASSLSNLQGVFFPEHYQNETLYYGINTDDVAAAGKAGKYGFIPTKMPNMPKLVPDTSFIMADGIITGYTGSGGVIVLPETDYAGNVIREIGENAFSGNTAITDVVFNRTIARIGAGAFVGCTGISVLTIPNTVEYIAPGAFDLSQKIACEMNSYAYYYAMEKGLQVNLVGGYNISRAEVSGRNVTVTLKNTSAVNLRVELMNDSRTETYYSATRVVAASEDEQQVTFEVGEYFEIPQYFALVVTMYDDNENMIDEPLVCLDYTQDYTTFRSKTPTDFEGGTILDYHDAGFAVLDAGVVTVIGDETNGSYIVASSTPIQVGSALYISNINAMVKVATVSDLGGGSYSVTSDENASLTDFYQYLRYSGSFDAMETLADLGEIEPNSYVAPNITAEASLARYVKTYEEGALKAEVSIGAKVVLDTNIDKALFGPDYIQCDTYVQVDGNVDYTLSKEWSYTKVFDLLHKRFPTPVEGLFVTLDLTLPITLNAEGSAEFTTNFQGRTGFSYNQHSGVKKIRDATLWQTLNATAELSATVGPQIDVGLSAMGLLNGSIGARIGAIFTATTTLIDIDTSTTPGSIHDCNLCFDLGVYKFVDLNAALNYNIGFVKQDLFKKTWDVYRERIYTGYLSVINPADSLFGGKVTMGEGVCPNHRYRVEIRTVDRNGLDVSGKAVTLSRKASGAWSPIATGSSPCHIYVHSGDYEAQAVFDDNTVKQQFKVEEDPVTIRLVNSMGIISGKVVDATTGQPISGAAVTCDAYAASTDGNGSYSLEVPAGSYTVEISKSEYIPMKINVTVVGNETSTVSCALNKILADAVRVVLTWGAVPEDLDSHLEWAGGHVYYMDMTGDSGNVMLDVDDTDSYGPETLTFVPRENVTYTYYVHDYTNRNEPSSTQMGASGATIEIYAGENYYKKVGVPAGPGNKWVVFTYKNGEFSFGNVIARNAAGSLEYDDTVYPEKQ